MEGRERIFFSSLSERAAPNHAATDRLRDEKLRGNPGPTRHRVYEKRVGVTWIGTKSAEPGNREDKVDGLWARGLVQAKALPSGGSGPWQNLAGEDCLDEEI